VIDNLSNILKSFVRKNISRWGYDLIKIQPLAEQSGVYSQKNINQLTLQLLTKKVVLSVSLGDMRVLHASAFLPNDFENNPWTFTLRQYRDDPSIILRDTALCRFYEAFAPRSAGEYYGVESTSSWLTKFKPYEIPLPWIDVDFSTYGEKHRRNARREALDHGVQLDIDAGWAACGPLSTQKLNFEFNRLKTVFDSILKNGYHRHDGEDGDIRCWLLVDEFEGRQVFLVRQGGHRVCAVGALGINTVPIRVTAADVILRSDVQGWAGVRQGYFTRDEALIVFDKILNGFGGGAT
jgi:hypothetical protein